MHRGASTLTPAACSRRPPTQVPCIPHLRSNMAMQTSFRPNVYGRHYVPCSTRPRTVQVGTSVLPVSVRVANAKFYCNGVIKSGIEMPERRASIKVKLPALKCSNSEQTAEGGPLDVNAQASLPATAQALSPMHGNDEAASYLVEPHQCDAWQPVPQEANDPPPRQPSITTDLVAGLSEGSSGGQSTLNASTLQPNTYHKMPLAPAKRRKRIPNVITVFTPPAISSVDTNSSPTPTFFRPSMDKQSISRSPLVKGTVPQRRRRVTVRTAGTPRSTPGVMQPKTENTASEETTQAAVNAAPVQAIGETIPPIFKASNIELLQAAGHEGAQSMVKSIQQELDTTRQLGVRYPMLAVSTFRSIAPKTRRKSKSESGTGLPQDQLVASRVGQLLLCWQVPSDSVQEQVTLRVGVIDLSSTKDAIESVEVIKEVWKLLGDPTICKVAHDAKPLHRLGIQLSFGKGVTKPTSMNNDAVEWQLGATSGLCTPLIDTMLAASLEDPEVKDGLGVYDYQHVFRRWGCPDTKHYKALVEAALASVEGNSVFKKYDIEKLAQVWGVAAQLHVHPDQWSARQTVPVSSLHNGGKRTGVESMQDARGGLDAARIQLLLHLEQPLQEVLAGMEWTGIKVDMLFLDELYRSYIEKVSQLEKRAVQIAKEAGWEGKGPFNLNNIEHLKQLIYDILRIRTDRDPEGKTRSTAKEVLVEMEGKHEFISVLREHRRLSLLLNNYIKKFKEALQTSTDGRIHTTYYQNGTATGRLSSKDPNVQSIPREGDAQPEEFMSIRDLFKPEDGMKFLSVDYSQMELRMLAALSGEPKLVEGYSQNQDIHEITARLLLGLDENAKVTKEERQLGKQTNFGIVYGMGAKLLALNVKNISEQQAKRFIEVFKACYRYIDGVMRRNEIMAVTQGYVESLFHRRRYFNFTSEELKALLGCDPDMVSLPNYYTSYEDSTLLRQAGNMPIQGTAADIMKRALVRTAAELLARGLQSRILLTVHDSLVLEVPVSEEAEVAELVKRCMECADDGMLNRVPLKAEIKCAYTWV